MTMTVSPERVILRVLQEAGQSLNRPITRTELVKLVYLVDYFYAQHTEGQTLSGLRYFWDNHGPNAIGNEIVKRADVMELMEGTIQSYEAVTSMGNSKFLYQAKDDSAVQPIDAGLAESVISEVVRSCGPLGWKGLTALSKRTRPMRGISQGDWLDLTPDPRNRQVFEIIRARIEQGAYDNLSSGMTLAELEGDHASAG